MRDVDVEIASLEVGGEAEVVEIAEALRDAFGQLEQAVDGFDGGVGEPGLQIGEDAGEMALDGARELSEGLEPGPVGPAQPPLQGGQVAALEHVGQGIAQTECAS